MTTSFDEIEKIRLENGFVNLALIDPDTKNDSKLISIINTINKSNFDGILVGGSKINDNLFNKRIKTIKEKSTLPLILFPGSSSQVSKDIDSMLYLNLISGRNPKYLIEEQVDASFLINNFKIQPIPTAYILLNGGTKTSVEIVSKTKPLNMNDFDNILKHTLAGKYLGNKIIYFDCGSGAKNKISISLLKYIKEKIDIPIMVGGGIKNNDDILELIKAGADYIVSGTMIEKIS